MIGRTTQVSRISLHTPRRSLGWLLVLVGAIALSPISEAKDDQRINRAKAAFVHKLAKFITWTDQQGGDAEDKTALNICFYRRDFLGAGYAQIADKTVSGRKLKPHVVDTLASAEHCDILLIADEQVSDFSASADSGLSSGILTIADMTSRMAEGKPSRKVPLTAPENEVRTTGAKPGVVIGLVRRGTRMAFEVNLQQARKQRLRISSELLKLAMIVKEAP